MQEHSDVPQVASWEKPARYATYYHQCSGSGRSFGRLWSLYLFMDLIKVTMKTAEMSIRRLVATKPSPMKMMVPRLA